MRSLLMSRLRYLDLEALVPPLSRILAQGSFWVGAGREPRVASSVLLYCLLGRFAFFLLHLARFHIRILCVLGMGPHGRSGQKREQHQTKRDPSHDTFPDKSSRQQR